MPTKLFFMGSACLITGTFVGIVTKSGWWGLGVFALLMVVLSPIVRPLEK